MVANSAAAVELPVLPFVSLKELFMSAPLDSVYGQELRQDAFDKDIVSLLLTRIGKLCSQDAAVGEIRTKKKLVNCFHFIPLISALISVQNISFLN